MSKIERVPKRPVYPTPAGLVTSVDDEGNPNIITLGEIFNISIAKPVIVGISIRPATYSHYLIKRSWEFVVNLPTAEIIDKVMICGSVSGRDVKNKFEEAGLTPLPAAKVKPPLIAECPVNLECLVLGIQRIGDHDLFLGEVIVEHIDEDKVNENGQIVVERLNVFSMIHGEFWTMGERLKV